MSFLSITACYVLSLHSIKLSGHAYYFFVVGLTVSPAAGHLQEAGGSCIVPVALTSPTQSSCAEPETIQLPPAGSCNLQQSESQGACAECAEAAEAVLMWFVGTFSAIFW